ncbi:MAG: Major facilitator superfamily [Microgenomates group bacterium GW2011_GWA1_Microgenomates_45_10]|nr:MAG: Major facilitator superfamily [Microgenomates group bacterium GW2011_GWA1_Microgenomates_45_10]
MNTRRNVFLWVLYDFANSIISIVFFLYFSQWLVIEQGIPDIWYNLAFPIAAVLLLLTVPTTGVLLDKYWRRIAGLRYTTIGTAVLYGFCSYLAAHGQTIEALVVFTIGLYFYLLSFTFYTPLLNDIASPEKRGRVSGYGIAANYLGQIAGLLIALPFATGSLNLFSGSQRAETLLPAVMVFFLLALPMLILFKEPPAQKIEFSYKTEVRRSLRETKTLFTIPGVFAFLTAYFFFNDAILTASNNFAIFLEQVWKISDTTKTYLMLGILATSALGGLVSGQIADRVGHKRTLIYILSGWLIILPLIAWITDFKLFVVAAIIMGLWFGSNWTVSRSVMSYLCPRDKHNLTFAYFGLVERVSAFVGPIVWGLVLSNAISLGPSRYRLAATVLTVFVFFGLLAMRKVPKDDIPRPQHILA